MRGKEALACLQGMKEMPSSSHCLISKDRHPMGIREEKPKIYKVQLWHHSPPIWKTRIKILSCLVGLL